MKYNTSDTKPCIIYVCDIRVLQHQLGMRENSYDIFINKCKFYWRIRQSNVRLICSFHITENCNINNYINVREYCRGNQKWTTTQPVFFDRDVCRRAHVLFMLFVLVSVKRCRTHIVWCFSSSCCKIFCVVVVHFWLPLQYSLTFM
jgi:hypothetical protein